MTFPVQAARLPSNLAGQTNGRLPDSLLVDVPGGRLHANTAVAWLELVRRAAADGIALAPTSRADTYRTYAIQESTFRARYTPVPLPGRPYKMWNGIRWYQKPGTAMSAVPGTSNHGLGLAIDVAYASGARLDWMVVNAPTLGFSWEVQSEPWHIRYVWGDLLPPTSPPMRTLIDWSHWQDNETTAAFPDLAQAQRMGVDGHMFKAGRGRDTVNPAFPRCGEDPDYRQFVAEARRLGLTWGGYWWPEPNLDADTPERQAELAFLTIHGPGYPNLPIDVDVEGYYGPQLSAEVYTAWLERFLRRLHDLDGRRPIIDTADWWWNSHVLPRFGDYDLRVAHYLPGTPPAKAQEWIAWIGSRQPDIPSSWSTWQAWQFSAGNNAAGATYGAESRDLDLNIVRVDVWNRWTDHPDPPSVGDELTDADLAKIRAMLNEATGFGFEGEHGWAHTVQESLEVARRTFNEVVSAKERIAALEERITALEVAALET